MLRGNWRNESSGPKWNVYRDSDEQRQRVQPVEERFHRCQPTFEALRKFYRPVHRSYLQFLNMRALDVIVTYQNANAADKKCACQSTPVIIPLPPSCLPNAGFIHIYAPQERQEYACEDEERPELECQSYEKYLGESRFSFSSDCIGTTTYTRSNPRQVHLVCCNRHRTTGSLLPFIITHGLCTNTVLTWIRNVVTSEEIKTAVIRRGFTNRCWVAPRYRDRRPSRT